MFGSMRKEGWPSLEWSFWRANCGCGWWVDILEVGIAGRRVWLQTAIWFKNEISNNQILNVLVVIVTILDMWV